MFASLSKGCGARIAIFGFENDSQRVEAMAKVIVAISREFKALRERLNALETTSGSGSASRGLGPLV